MAVQNQSAVVELRIPCRPEFVGVARLAILGVASRMPFSYDEVEDIRLAVGEACTTAVQRAIQAGQTDKWITITSEIIDDKLTIDVADQITSTPSPSSDDSDLGEGIDATEISGMLIQLLVDEIKVESTPEQGTRVQLTKFVG